MVYALALVEAPARGQNLPQNVYTGIWWCARFPNPYSGDGSLAPGELGQLKMNAWIDGIVNGHPRRQDRPRESEAPEGFFEKPTHPLETRHPPR